MPVVHISNAALQGFYVPRLAFQREGAAPVVELDVSKINASSKLKGLFMNMGEWGML